MGSIIVFLIIISPLIFYTYRLFPKVTIWETAFFTFESKGYQNVYSFAWVFIQKFVFLYLFVIWFVTNKNWWHHVIVVPITMLLFQIITLINWEVTAADELELYWMIPIIAMVLFVIYKIRKKLKYYTNSLDLLDKVNNEIEKIESSQNE